jgi:hypothetical protein
MPILGARFVSSCVIMMKSNQGEKSPMMNRRFPFLFPVALLFAVKAQAATVTLSQAGIVALDYKAPSPSGSILHAEARAGGVEYTVSVRSRLGGVYLFSKSDKGQGLLAGLPWTSGDRFGLRFTFMPTDVPGMTLSAGVLINGAYGRVGIAPGESSVDSTTVTGAGGTAVETVGFQLDFATPADVEWPENGAVVRVFVQPLADATQLQPRGEPSPLPDAAPGRTLTLSAADLATLRVPGHGNGSATMVSAVPSGSGVLYTLHFNGKHGSIALELPANSPLLAARLTGSESFALKFTVKATTPQPEAVIGAAVSVNGPSVPVFLRSTLTAGLTSDIGTVASVIQKLAIIVYIPPSDEEKWPAAGSTVQILAEPAANAIPIEEIRP